MTRDLLAEPWLEDPKYGGMSRAAAELSYRASQLRNRESVLIRPDKTIIAPNRLGFRTTPRPLLSLKFEKYDEIKPTTETRYLIKGIIPRVGLVVVWGAPKCGKSFWLFDLAMHVATGQTYRGRPVEQQSVVYFAFEGQEGFRARINAAQQRWASAPLYLCGERLSLPVHSQDLIENIKKHEIQPGIVVLDTLNRSIEGSENDPSDMGGYIAAVDAIREAFQCAVIVVHHCGTNETRPRGHTSLTGAADAQISIKKNGRSEIVSKVEYLKDGPEGAVTLSRLEQVELGVDKDGDPIVSCVIQNIDGSAPSSESARTTAMRGRTRSALLTLKDMINAVGQSGATSDGSASLDDWRSQCLTAFQTEGANRAAAVKAFGRAVKALTEARLINQAEGRVWLA